jgi:four helix bundle protein
MQDYRKLKVWEKAHALVMTVYGLTPSFPHEETFGIVAQMRRTSAAVPMRIAEASGQDAEQDFARLISSAIGAGKELE